MSDVKVPARVAPAQPNTFFADYKIDAPAAKPAAGSGTSAYQFAQHKTPAKSKARDNALFRPPPEPSADQLDTFKLLVKQGNEYFKTENYERAFEYYGRAVTLNPRDAAAKLKLADAAVKLEQVGVAHDIYTERLNLQPDDKDTRKKRLHLISEWFKAMEPLVTKYRKKQELSEAEKEGAKAFLKIAHQLNMEKNVDTVVLQSLDVEESKKALEQEFSSKSTALRALPTTEKKQFIAMVDLRVSAVLNAARLPLGDPDFSEATIRRLKETVAHGYGLLKKFAAEDSDPQIKAYADLYTAKEFALSENYAEAATLYRSIAQRGYAQLGAGDEALGRKKLEDILAKVGELQKEAEAEFAKKGNAKDLEAKMEQIQKRIQETTSELPPGLADAHQFVTHVDTAKVEHLAGLKQLGNGDVEAGRKIAEEKIARGKQLNDESVALSKQIREAAGKFQYGEISKLMKSREEKAKEAEEIAKSLPSLNFVQSFLMLEQITASEQKNALLAAQAVKLKELQVRISSFDVWSELINARRDQMLADADNAWFVGTIGMVFRKCPWLGDGKTRFHDVTESYFQHLDLWGEAHRRVGSKSAVTLKEAVEQVEKTGNDQQKSDLKVYRGQTLEGISFDEVLDYSAGYGKDLTKGNKLLGKARGLTGNSRTKPVAKALFTMLALSPDAKLAGEAAAELKKL